MMLHGSQPPQSPTTATTTTTTNDTNNTSTTTADNSTHDSSQPMHAGRKRKADSQDNNERLSKRLSLLNLEQNGSKLYVPVEDPTVKSSKSAGGQQPETIPESGPGHAPSTNDDTMYIDDSKHKVYIYNIDDELSSSDESTDDGRLVFLPDIEKHLKANRIPPHVLANSDGELAGMQMVLYSDPKSLTVPEDKDSVRKAIIESRKRLRDQQQHGTEDDGQAETSTSGQGFQSSSNGAVGNYDSDAMDMD